MKVTAHEISLTQRHLWRSAREAIPVQHALIVEVEHDGVTGFGEASAFMTNHYNSGLEQLHGDLRRVAPLLAALRPDNPSAVWEMLSAELRSMSLCTICGPDCSACRCGRPSDWTGPRASDRAFPSASTSRR